MTTLDSPERAPAPLTGLANEGTLSGLLRWDQLVAGVTDYAIFSLDPAGHVTSWNDGARNIKGYEPHEIIGQHFSRFYPAEAIERKWPDFELRVATTEGRFEDEGWRVRKDGSSFWANVVITAIRDEAGKLLGFCKITRDLTERRRHEEELRQSEQRLRTLMESLTEHAIFMLDANGFITSWSTGCERILGYRAAEIMWKHVSNLYRSEEIIANKPWAEIALAADQGNYESEGWRQRKDGTPFRTRVAIRAVYDEQGEPCGYAHILTPAHPASQDAANTVRALRWLLEKELRTRLVPIRNALELMKRRQLADPVAGSMLDTISSEIEELATIVRRVVDP
jgi:PAS domain S-box-containing protein